MMAEVWAEYGAIGVIVFLFVGQILFLQKTLMSRLLDIENEEKATRAIVVDLINRWNRSDETRDRRHEKLVEEVNDLGDIMNRVEGSVSRINGKG
tara:strand:- start:171 stop:455 length:285 start_codon:yes stop_codon:yes gene_type:complete